jgi:methionine sulfoxide reductase heme-binding subunit
MPEITALDISAYLGLVAVGAATLNQLLGLLMALRYSPVRRWPHRRINVFALHQWTAYIAVAFTLAHPVVLLFQHAPRFRIIDLLWPIHSPLQPWINFAGAAAMYVLLLILTTSLLRHRIGRPLWRKLHYLAFPTAALIFLHSILTDPNLKDGKPDLLDGGKVFIEICFLLCVIAVIVRLRMRGKGLRPVSALRSSEAVSD